MKTRKLGTSDLELSVIGFGAWAIGGGDWKYGWGDQDEGDSLAALHEAADFGINWVDTAAVYGFGKSELTVGKFLKERPGAMHVATKCGLIRDKNNQPQSRLTKRSVRDEAEQSLKRLGISCIDLYQIHWPNPADQIEAAFDTMLELQREGKIRHLGVSNFQLPHLERVAPRGTFVALQPPYSLLNREIERQILPWCAAHAVGVIAYSPLQSGLLTGKVTREWLAALPENDWRRAHGQYFKEPKFSVALEQIEMLKGIAEDLRVSLAQLSVAWVLHRPDITAAIVGARRQGQLSQIIEAADLQIPPEILERIDAIRQESL